MTPPLDSVSDASVYPFLFPRYCQIHAVVMSPY